MSDQGFDIVHRAGLHRRRGQMVIRLVRTARHLLHALFDNPQALTDFLHAHPRAVITIAILRDWNVELELFVSAIGLPLTKIPIESGSPKISAGDAPLDSFVRGKRANAFGARLEDPVTQNSAVVF